MDTQIFVLSINSSNIIKDLQNREDLFEFCKLGENHETFSNKNKRLFAKVKIETPKIIWKAEFICLRSKAYSCKSGSDN